MYILGIKVFYLYFFNYSQITLISSVMYMILFYTIQLVGDNVNYYKYSHVSIINNTINYLLVVL